MANPQKENGYVPLANEIMDAVARTYFSPGERQVLDVILRKTYGFNKKEDAISFSQFVENTNLSRRATIEAVQNLVARHIVFVKRKRNAVRNDPNVYAFNKDYEVWVVNNCSPYTERKRIYNRLRSEQLRTTPRGSEQQRKKVVNNGAPTKDNTTKDKIHASQSDAMLIVKVIDSFEGINPSFKRWYMNNTQRLACDRLICEHGLDTVLRVIGLLPKTNAKAYFPTITTPVQLENDWAKLRYRLEQERDKGLTKGRGVEE